MTSPVDLPAAVPAPAADSEAHPLARASDPTHLRSPGITLLDLIALTKPRITSLVVATMLGGMWVASRLAHTQQTRAAIVPTASILAVIGTILVVAGANALNMYLERDTDGLMERTRDRPLPAGRLSPDIALWFGIALSAIALPILLFAVNTTTGLLAAFALATYVLAYTPLKRRTTLALLIGAVPGAIPPLQGYTSVTGHIDLPGLVLFGILFLWQIPHFLAIAIFRREDYRRAGLKILPIERGERATRRQIVGYLVALVAVTLLPFVLGMAGPIYLASALALGIGFLAFGTYGLSPAAGVRWARWLFVVSIPYLALLHAALMIGA
jgi:protoheme IX farnesyltransferase